MCSLCRMLPCKLKVSLFEESAYKSNYGYKSKYKSNFENTNPSTNIKSIMKLQIVQQIQA